VKNWRDYLELWLNKLEKKTSLKRARFNDSQNIPNHISSSLSASSRDNLLDFFGQNLGLIEITNPEKTKTYHIFRITKSGRNYLIFNNQNEKDYKLHGLLNKTLFHYSFAFNYIISKELYKADFDQLKEKLIQASLDILGFPIYDRHSFSNIKYVFQGLYTIFQIDNTENEYELSEEYKLEFYDDKFREKVKDLLSSQEIKYTYSLCKKLNQDENKRFFLSRNYNYYNDKIIFEKLKDLEFIRFKGGLARRFIPSSYTLIELI
jgi:hypothetical protein